MRRALFFCFIALTAAPAAVSANEPLDLQGEIARLRGRLAANSAQEQHCLAGSTQPIWTAALAGDLKTLQARANQAAAEGASAEAQRWRDLARKAEALEARTAANARTGAELFQSQQIGIDCLDRFAGEREALRASLEVAVADPDAYGESLGEARAHGTARLRHDLLRLQDRSRALSARWKLSQADASDGALALKAETTDLRRRNTRCSRASPHGSWRIRPSAPPRRWWRPPRRGSESGPREIVSRRARGSWSVGRPAWSATCPRVRRASTGSPPSGCSAGASRSPA